MSAPLTAIVGWLLSAPGNNLTINYTNSTKAVISNITFSDGRVLTFNRTGSTSDVITRTS